MPYAPFRPAAPVEFRDAAVGDRAGFRLKEFVRLLPEEVRDFFDVGQLQLMALAVEKARHPRAVFAAAREGQTGRRDMIAGEQRGNIEPEIMRGFQGRH